MPSPCATTSATPSSSSSSTSRTSTASPTDAIVRHPESFLLELGAGFTFVARAETHPHRRRVVRIDLLLYHRALRCLVVVDLKLGKFSHADAGQMNLYLNEHRPARGLASQD